MKAGTERFRLHLPALAGYILAVALLHLPLILHLNSHVIGRPIEDVFEVLWQLDWMRKAVLEGRSNLFYSPDVFYPTGWHLASGGYASWYFLALVPLTILFGPLVTNNGIQLLALVAAGFGAYLLAFQFIRYRAGSFLAGCIYFIAPIITLRLGGHLNILLAAMWLPYVYLAFHKVLSTSGRWRWSIICGLMGGAMILASWYFLFVGGLPLLGFLLVRNGRRTWRNRLLPALVAAVLALIIVSPFAYLTWRASQETFGQRIRFSSLAVDSFNLSPDRLFLPSFDHALWGPAVKERFDLNGERDLVAIGYTATVLAIAGLITGPKKLLRPWFGVAALSLVLALGITLHWAGQRIEVQAPPIVANIYRWLDIAIESEATPIMLPGALLHRYLPLYDGLRVSARFDIPFMLSVAIFAGFGATYLAKRAKRGPMLVIGAVLLVLFEGLTAPYQNFTPVSVNDRQANSWLASLADDVALIEYPYPAVNKVAMYGQSLHGRRLVNGQMSQMPAFHRQYLPTLGEWPSEEALALLRQWQVDYIVLNGSQGDDYLQEILPQVESLPGLCLVKSFDDGHAYWTRTDIFELRSADAKC